MHPGSWRTSFDIALRISAISSWWSGSPSHKTIRTTGIIDNSMSARFCDLLCKLNCGTGSSRGNDDQVMRHRRQRRPTVLGDNDRVLELHAAPSDAVVGHLDVQHHVCLKLRGFVGRDEQSVVRAEPDRMSAVSAPVVRHLLLHDAQGRLIYIGKRNSGS